MFWDTVCFSIPIHAYQIKSSVWSRLCHPGSNAPVSSSFTKRLPNISHVKLLLDLNLDTSTASEHLPSITLKKQGGWWSVWVEGSMGKFFFGTNTFELTEEDRVRLLLRLEYFLHKQDLFVKTSDIRNAVLHKLDVSKVLLVPPTVSLYKVLEHIKKMDIDIRNEILDKEYKSLREGGKGLQVSFGTKKKKFLSLYDKIEETANNSKKSPTEKELLTFIENNGESSYQLLKYEESLHDKTKLDRVCNMLTGQNKKYYTFNDLWSRTLIRKILLYHGEQLFHSPDTKIMLLGNGTPSEIQQVLKTSFPKVRASRLSSVAHWASLAHELGLKETKKRLKKDFSKSTQYRILKDTRELLSKMEKLPMQDVFDEFYGQLRELKAIRSTNDLLIVPKEE